MLPSRFAFGLLLACSTVAAAATDTPGVESGDWRTRLEWQGRWSTVERTSTAGGGSRYRFAAGGDGAPARERLVSEAGDQPRLRTGSDLFDGLFALALAEAASDSVDSITDGAFADGRPIPCACFETGEKWRYVWTRDISYSVDLALAYLDPPRATRSLFFKVSPARAGVAAPAELVAEDTGSGGSWPVSTDRVAWIHAATDVLRTLPQPEAARTEPRVRSVALAVLDQDREYAFDGRVGLYRGETSFLDWREQSYPAWTRDDARFVAESYSLSTNVLHYVALRDAAQLERRAGGPRAAELDGAAARLRTAINARFWRADRRLYASVLGPDLAPLPSADLLGLALAVVHGVADAAQARAILARYPVAPGGPPVIWPEQPGIPIYHNRAVWPFVTAYALQAARAARDVQRMSEYGESLVRGAALALSNMENFEFLSQRVAVDDGPLSGPVVNSPRQLWSVAGYVDAVVDTVFGVRVDGRGIAIAPAIPGALAARLFRPGETLALERLRVGNLTLNLTLQLPPQWSARDLLEAGPATLDGVAVPGPIVLPPGPEREVAVHVLLEARPGSARAREPAAPDHLEVAAGRGIALFAPRTPVVTSASRSGARVRLTVAGLDPGGRWQVYRDGVPRPTPAAGDVYIERLADPRRTHCYSVSQRSSDHESLPSPAVCLEGAASRRLLAAAGKADGGSLTTATVAATPDGAGGFVFRDWGAPADRLDAAFRAPADGLLRLVLHYENPSGPVNTGITAAVKRVEAVCGTGPAQPGTIVMPQLPHGTQGTSTGFVFTARRGDHCRIAIGDGFNMSYLAHFALYTGGRGGREGPWNRADVHAAQIDAIDLPLLARR
ncbi:MAG: Six-hairpin glycosidase-like protein [Proteobacteria bacterium]|nr:Six-hairpin glycosidase-like protein [Pseudomonadota bacterium]